MAIRLKDEAALKATSATKLATARTINGTSFDGSANITTSNWGTGRTLTIGNTGKTVNGSGNVSWTLSEIGAAAATHNHGLLHSDFTVQIANTTTDSGWSMINSSYNGYLLKSIRTQASAPAWIQNNYAAGIAFGGADTKGVLSVSYNSPSIRFAGGNSTTPTWYLTLTGTSAKTYNMDSLAANTANTLATARTINGTSFNGSANITTANWGTARTLTIGNSGKSVNGSGNVSWSLSEIGAVPLSGGTMTGALSFKSASNIEGAKLDVKTTSDVAELTLGNNLAIGATGKQRGQLRLYGSSTGCTMLQAPNGSTAHRLIWLPDKGGTLALTSDNVASATILQTARTINGTSFNGSANITTANWGTARTLTVGKTGKSVNGAGNVSWSLSEIGALPLTGGTLTGALTANAIVNLECGAVTAVDSHISFGGNSRIHENVFAINDVTSGLTHLYLGPRDTGEMRVVAFGDADKMQYRPMRAAQYNCDAGTGIRGQLWCGTGGFVVQGEEGANLHLGANNQSNHLTIYGNPDDTNTGIHMNLAVTAKSGIDMVNSNIENVNALKFADPGYNEGIEWVGGNGWKIYEAPDGLTNAAGNLQFVTGSTRRATFSTSGNLNLAGNNVTFTTSNAVVTASAGYLVLKSNAGDIVYAQGGSLRVTGPSAPSTYKPVLASAFTVSSLSKYKDDITPIEEDKSIDTMEILKNTNVYTYKLKDELENGIDKKKIGLIVEQASLDLSDNEEEGIELYQMASTLWDVCKQQQEKIEELEHQNKAFVESLTSYQAQINELKTIIQDKTA